MATNSISQIFRVKNSKNLNKNAETMNSAKLRRRNYEIILIVVFTTKNLLLRLLVCLKVIGMNLVMNSKGLLMKVPRLLQSPLRFSGLETARALDLKRIIIFCDNLPVYRYAMHAWQPKQRKVVNLMEKVEFLQKEFTYYRLCLVSRNVIKFAFKLARDAITSQISKPTEPIHLKILKETCVICLEETVQDKMFTIDRCLHKYCFSCMKQHVEAKLHNGMVPKCPHENCKYELNVSSCEKFLSPKLIEIMKQRVREASIPVAEKVYCPYPRCSVLMSRAEINDFARKENVNRRISGVRKCLKCHGLFCIYCRVPWHNNMSCLEYKRSNPNPQPEDAKLKSLATKNLWRQCVKCKHMIELAQGCYHMTCR
uniref:RBR-type E3 ubiquitin transferase n=1 Tax=Chenopodium quinoa TaxID=63459 RepID=A0A803L3S0_CHEQI